MAYTETSSLLKARNLIAAKDSDIFLQNLLLKRGATSNELLMMDGIHMCIHKLQKGRASKAR